MVSIVTAKLASQAVLTANISNAQITNALIVDANITEAKIQDNAVNSSKSYKEKFTISTAAPSGGSDGDIWFKYS